MTWRPARSLDTLLAQLNAAFPKRDRTSDGAIGDAEHATRASDHNPWYVLNGQPLVTARDYDHDPAHGADMGRLALELAASRDPRIKYVIYNRRILDTRPATWTWGPYSGVNAHQHHLHLSVVASPACDDPRPWSLPMLTGRPASGGATQGDDMTPDQAAQLDEILKRTRVFASQLQGPAKGGAVPGIDEYPGYRVIDGAPTETPVMTLHELRKQSAKPAPVSLTDAQLDLVADKVAAKVGPTLAAQVADILAKRLES
jgi:hypothetical protein